MLAARGSPCARSESGRRSRATVPARGAGRPRPLLRPPARGGPGPLARAVASLGADQLRRRDRDLAQSPPRLRRAGVSLPARAARGGAGRAGAAAPALLGDDGV